jgi:hypothetical protein
MRSRGIVSYVPLLLVWLVAGAAALLLVWGSKLTFLLDDWEFLIYRRGFNAEAILEPHGEHIVVAPVLIYKALLATFGMGSAFPFHVVSVGLFLLSAVLLFVYLRRRIGAWPALAGTAVVLFLGAAWEDLLWSFQIGYFGGMAAGLGALLALDREDRRGDAIACVLLVAGVLFSDLTLAFVVGIGVQILLGGDRWRRLWIVVLPLIVLAIWYAGWGHNAESALSAANVAKTPLFFLNGIAASFASLFGLATPTAETGAGGLEWGRPIAVAAIGLGIWRAFHLGGVPRQTWVVLAILATFWILAGFNQEAGRDPTSSRYQYVGVIFLLLIGAELLRGLRFEPGTARGVVAVILVFAAASVASNVYYLHQAYANGYLPISRLEKASLGAVEIARATVPPTLILSEELTGTGYVNIEAGPYLSARDEFGSPAYSPAEISEAVEPARFAADKVLYAALGIGLESVPASRPPRAQPALAEGSGPFVVPAGGCVEAIAAAGKTPLLELPPTGAWIEVGTSRIEAVDLERFAVGEPFPLQLGEGIAPGTVAELAIPKDGASVPWKMQLKTNGDAVVCGRGGAEGGTT